MLAAAIAPELDVVPRGGGRRGTTVAGRLRLALAERLRGRLGEAHALIAQRAHGRRRTLVQRHLRAPDRLEPLRVRVVEQLGHQLGRRVGREAEPPALVGTREVDEALAPPAPAPAPLDRPCELRVDLRRGREALQQPPERVRLLGFERHAPNALPGVPAAPGYRTQQQAQLLVVGKAQDRFVTVDAWL